MYYSILEKISANCGTRTAEYFCGSLRAEFFSGEKHSATVVAGHQNFSLVRNILQLWKQKSRIFIW